MTQRSKKGAQAKKVGITHFPVEKEQNRQEQVRASQEAGGRNVTQPGVGGRGHRLSRTAAPQPQTETQERFEARGSKGEKTRGSRAGLLASRKEAKR